MSSKPSPPYTPSPQKRFKQPSASPNYSSHHKRFGSDFNPESFSLSSSSLQLFFQELLKETRRISPAFSYDPTDGFCLSQVLKCYKQCVNQYLQRYSSQIIRNQKMESLETSSDDSTKNQEILKTLMNFEKVLNRKEVKLKEKSVEIKTELVNLQRMVESFEEEKEKWNSEMNLEKEKIESEKKHLLVECQQLEAKFVELRDFYFNLEKKEVDLKQMENSLSEEKSRLYVQRSEQDNVIWEISKKQSELESQESILRLQIEHLAQEKLEFENEKKQREVEGRRKHSRKCSSNFLQRFHVRNSNESGFEVNDISPLNLSFEQTIQSVILCESRDAKDFEVAYIELNDKIEKINKEFEAREQSLQLREEEIALSSKDLQEKYSQFELISQCLQESKSYIEDFNTQTIQESENCSNALISLITSLNTQKQDLQILVDQVQRDLFLIKKYKHGLDIIIEEPDKKNSGKKHSDLETNATSLSDSD